MKLIKVSDETHSQLKIISKRTLIPMSKIVWVLLNDTDKRHEILQKGKHEKS